MTQVRPPLSLSPVQLVSPDVSIATMQAPVPTALTLAPTRTLVEPQNAFPQASILFLAFSFIPSAFPMQMSKATSVSRRLGFGESPPPVMGVVSKSPFSSGLPPLSHYFPYLPWLIPSKLLSLGLFHSFPSRFPLAQLLQVRLLTAQMISSNKSLIPWLLALVRRQVKRKGRCPSSLSSFTDIFQWGKRLPFLCKYFPQSWQARVSDETKWIHITCYRC